MDSRNKAPLMRKLFYFLLLITYTSTNNPPIAWAQQSAAGQDTLIGVVGTDYVMIGADSSSSGGGGISLTSSNIDKIAVVHDGSGGKRFGKRSFFSESDGVGGSDWYDCLSRESLEQQAIVVAFAGDAADADRLVGALKTHTQIREYEAGIGNDVECVFDGTCKSASYVNNFGDASPAGLDTDAIANLARNEIASRLRSRQPIQLCLLVGGMVRCHNPVIKPLGFTNSGSASSFSARVQNQVLAGSAAYSLKKDGIPTEKNKLETEPNNYDVPSSMGDGTKLANPFLVPKLFWLDQYGSLQSLRYAAHGHGSNFALSVLDQRYRSDMTRQEAVALIEECFEQLRQRYVINSPQPPRIKCVDADGVIEIGCIENK